MKLNLLFIVIDLLTLLAIPIVYMLARLSRFAEANEISAPASSLDAVADTQVI